MKHIYVVAHPQTTHHISRTVGGWYDGTVLTDLGRTHAGNIATYLRSLIPLGSRVFLHSSDLQRCTQTAEIISSHFDGLPPTNISKNIREYSFGEADGKPQAFLNERIIFPPGHSDDHNIRLDHDCNVKESETRRQLATRVYDFMNKDCFPIFEKEEEKDYVYQIVVTHGVSATFVTAAWVGVPIEYCGSITIATSPGSITHLREDDVFHNRTIVSVNVTSHLEGVEVKERPMK